MIIQLYIKKDTIGLCLASKTDRDLLWTQLGDQQNCAERFGERTIRFYPAKATASFNIALEAEMNGVFVDKPKAEPKLSDLPKTTKPVAAEVMVVPTAPAPIEPVAIIPAQPSMVAAELQPPVAQLPPTVTGMPQVMIEMPQVASLAAPFQPNATVVAKPPDLRSRAGREWKAQQDQIAKQQQLAAQ